MYSAVFFGWPTTSISPSRVDVHADLQHRGGQDHVERARAPLGHRLARLAQRGQFPLPRGRVERRVER